MIITPREFDYDIITRSKTIEGGNKPYVDLVCAFDIETSKLPFCDDSVMYMWQMQIGETTPTIIGRTWGEFSYLIRNIIKHLGDRTLVIWVHNLSYEFEYLSGIYKFRNNEVFAVKSRRVLRATMFGEKIELRCSYLHSNKSLARWAADLHVEHQKLDGAEFNYYDYRTSYTILTEQELLYGAHDVLAVVECITQELRRDGDNLATIPLTSTGYVRRDAKRALGKYRYGKIRSILPNYGTYVLLKQAFRGGDTHANRYYSGVTIDDEVHSMDRSSSYPDVVCNALFPMEPFKRVPGADDNTLITMLGFGRPVLLQVAFWGLSLEDVMDPNPYISKSKCRNIYKGPTWVEDNGRIISAGYIETTLTDIDFKIIIEKYSWEDMKILALEVSKYKPLPKEMRELIINLYRAKTALKGDKENEYNYMRSKEKLNAGAYGMFAQDPAKLDITYDAISGEFGVSEVDSQEEKILNYDNSGWLPYQWGVWITAHARERLYRMQKIVGKHDLIYWDTDSVKYIGNHDFGAYNDTCISESTKNGAYATDSKGRTHYMGVAEEDGCYSRFRTLGAKKYAYEDNSGLHITIAGVAKRLGAKEMCGGYRDYEKKYCLGEMIFNGNGELVSRGNKANHYRGIDSLDEGFTFYKAGGSSIVYNDSPTVPYYYINGKRQRVSRNSTIMGSYYTVGVTADYQELIAACWVRLKEQLIGGSNNARRR